MGCEQGSCSRALLRGGDGPGLSCGGAGLRGRKLLSEASLAPRSAAGPGARRGAAGRWVIEARRQQAAEDAALHRCPAALRGGGLIPAVLLGAMAGSRRGLKVSVKLSRPPRRGGGAIATGWADASVTVKPRRGSSSLGEAASLAQPRPVSTSQKDERADGLSLRAHASRVLLRRCVVSCEPPVSKRGCIVLGTTCEALRLGGVDIDLTSIVLPDV